MIVPEVTARALAVTSSRRATTCGSAADSADRKNRLTPSTSSDAPYSAAVMVSDAATAPTSTARTSGDQTRMRCRDQRSMKTPANGPTIEYGNSSTAKVTAALAGEVC